MSGELVFSLPSVFLRQEPGSATHWVFGSLVTPCILFFCPFLLFLPWFMSCMYMMLSTMSTQMLLYCPPPVLSIQKVLEQSDEMNASCFSGSSASVDAFHLVLVTDRVFCCSFISCFKMVHQELMHDNIFSCCHSLINGNYHLPSMKKHIPRVVCEMNCPKSHGKQKRLGKLGW